MVYASLFALTLVAQAGSSTVAPAGDDPAPAPAPSPAAPAEAPPPETYGRDIRATDFFYSSDYVDTRVTFAFSNINVFAGPGERLYTTSGYRIGIDPNFNLFLENVNTRFTGYETLSQLVLYKKMKGFWPLWETEAALAARLSASVDTGQLSFYDSGTYLRIIRKLGDGKEEDVGSFDLTAWPVSSDRFRLGYTYLISWGGTTIFPTKLTSSISEGAVPGMRLRWRAPKGEAYAFLGFKAALILSRDPGVKAGEQVPVYGLLGGAGVTLADHFIVEANGGIYQKGTQERPGLEGNKITAFGASGRLTFFEGNAPASSADYRLFRNDRQNPDDYRLFKAYKPGVGYSIALEGNILGQNLEDPDRFATEKMVIAAAAGLVGQLKVDQLLLRLDAFFQSADFILFDVPGFVPFQATPSASSTTPEFFAAVTAEYFFPDLYFRPSLGLGVKKAATYRGAVPADLGPVSGANAGEVRTQIIVDNRTRIILPPDTSATPIIGVVLKLPFYFSEMTAISAEARFEFNDNQVRLAKDNERGERTYFFDDPARLSLALVLQSRW
ncbi:MAG: hypothetical protein U1E65_33260 [Myxococcota bacterium]